MTTQEALTTQQEALAPLREVLLARAEEYARRVRTDADVTATAALQRARADAAQIVEAARDQGAADAQDVLAGQRARVRRQVRALVLHARRAAYDDLCRTAREDARRLVADSPGLAERLGALGRDQLGPEACLSALPDGTVVAELGGRRCEWSPDALAADAVRQLGQEVEQLWAP